MNSIIENKKGQFEKAIEHLKLELTAIRTGRANPSLVENLLIDYYGVKTPLKQLSSINVPDAHSLLIQPWDKNSIKDIEKGIRASSLDLNPVNEGNAIRLPIPALTEERRRELTKAVRQKTEEAKVSIRNVREEIWKQLKEQKNSGAISEDDMFHSQKELQKMVDQYNAQLVEISTAKENEVMTI